MGHTVSLGALFKVGSSKRVLKSQWKTEGVPFYRGREITRLSIDGFVNNELFISESDYAEYSAKYGVPSSGDIVITAIGTIGNTYIVKEGDRFYFKDASVLWLNKTSEVSSKFIKLWLKSPLFFDQLDKGNGATVDTLTIKKLQNVQIDLPPLPEQKRIVSILDEAFAGIDAAVANAEKNLANARELFESYLNGVFTRKGDGWVEKNLGDVCSIKHGFAFKGEFFRPEGEFVLLTPGSFYEYGGYRDQGVKTKFYVGDVPKDYLLKKDDFLFAMTEQATGLLGSSLVVPEEKKYLHNQRLGLVQVNDGVDWHNDFFFHQFNSIQFRKAVQSSASGVKVRHTSPKKLGSILVAYPPSMVEQQEIADRLNDLLTETQRLETIYQQKLTALAELKQSILQKAFAGELTD